MTKRSKTAPGFRFHKCGGGIFFAKICFCRTNRPPGALYWVKGQRKGARRLDLSAQYDKIYRYCCFHLRDPQLAEDLTQETFLRFYRQASYQEQGKALAYLYTIARNLCLDAVRRRRPEAPLPDDHPAPDPYAPIDRTLALRQALDTLPADLRELLLLRYVNELSVGDIAVLTGLSRYAVYRRLRAGLADLKHLLREEEL